MGTPIEPEVRMNPAPQTPKRPALLLVDDEQPLLRSLARWLRERFEVVCATSGEEGLLRLGDRPFAAVVSDQRMRGMQGTEFLQKVSERWPETLRVLMTGYGDLEAASRALLDGRVSVYLK